MKIFNGIFRIKNLNILNQQRFNNNIWKKILVKRINKNRKINYPLISSSPLSVILSTQFYNKKVKVLDLGSGALDIYFELNSILSNCSKLNKEKNNLKKITLDLVELPIILRVYKEIKFSKKFKINLLSSFNPKKKYDIIHISNSLHYFEEPKKLINLLLKSKAKYIILNSTKVGNIQTFVTLQKFYKYSIPIWFFSIKDLVKEFMPNYKLVFVSNYLHKYFGKFSKLPMKNFPKKLRIDHTKTLIFEKKN